MKPLSMTNRKRGQWPGIRGVRGKEGTTRARIERVALRLFNSQGADATGIRELAETVGVTQAALYRHFISKDELVTDLFAAQHERLGRLIARVGEAETRFDARLEAIIAGMCREADADWDLFRFYLLHMHLVLPVVKEQYGDPVSLMRDMVEQAMHAKEILEGNPELLTTMALGLVMQVALHKSYGRISASMTSMCPELIRAAHKVFVQ